jgi:membrane protein YdbS with pleckstrin-like domain
MRKRVNQGSNLIYKERISSNKTEALFLALMFIFFLLLVWRISSANVDWIAVVIACFFVIFLFYSVNYRTLLIHLTSDSLKLKFGIFLWTVTVDNIQECRLDELPVIMKYGGAGIHFMTIRKRYRASFNFLEYPRVVIAFKNNVGPVRDISFSTRRPDEIIQHIEKLLDANRPASLRS